MIIGETTTSPGKRFVVSGYNVRSNQPLVFRQHLADNLLSVWGEPYFHFAINFRNLLPNDYLEVLVTVDGTDIFSGTPGDFDNDGRIVSPGSRVTFSEGIMRGDSARPLQFGWPSRQADTASKEGRPSTAGVIGIAAYRRIETSMGLSPSLGQAGLRRLHPASSLTRRTIDFKRTGDKPDILEIQYEKPDERNRLKTRAKPTAFPGNALLGATVG